MARKIQRERERVEWSGVREGERGRERSLCADDERHNMQERQTERESTYKNKFIHITITKHMRGDRTRANAKDGGRERLQQNSLS